MTQYNAIYDWGHRTACFGIIVAAVFILIVVILAFIAGLLV